MNGVSTHFTSSQITCIISLDTLFSSPCPYNWIPGPILDISPSHTCNIFLSVLPPFSLNTLLMIPKNLCDIENILKFFLLLETYEYPPTVITGAIFSQATFL